MQRLQHARVLRAQIAKHHVGATHRQPSAVLDAGDGIELVLHQRQIVGAVERNNFWRGQGGRNRAAIKVGVDKDASSRIIGEGIVLRGHREGDVIDAVAVQIIGIAERTGSPGHAIPAEDKGVRGTRPSRQPDDQG